MSNCAAPRRRLTSCSKITKIHRSHHNQREEHLHHNQTIISISRNQVSCPKGLCHPFQLDTKDSSRFCIIECFPYELEPVNLKTACQARAMRLSGNLSVSINNSSSVILQMESSWRVPGRKVCSTVSISILN